VNQSEKAANQSDLVQWMTVATTVANQSEKAANQPSKFVFATVGATVIL
jgi:hypothetical protein